MRTFEEVIEREEVVQFEYNSHGDFTIRTVSVWQIDVINGSKSIFGWDHDREAPRRFSLDKIPTLPSSYEFEEFVRPAT